ncbi:MAG TPA: serine--tRNA ligase, partial [Deltaproteobacteria bacterium]|nr:serine--tRNA ligase [Deltaproteobacteria bacterium]
MLDIKTIRQNIDLVKTALKNRGTDVDLNVLIDLDARRRALIQEAEDLKAKRNQFSQLMAKGKSEGIDIDARKNEMREISERIKAIDGELKEAEDAVTSFVLEIPNIPHESVP